MARCGISLWHSLLGIGFAVAGADKLLGQRGYERMFHHWGWSEQQMRAIGLAEFTGGLLVACPAMRRLGGLILTASSAVVLTAELRRKQDSLAAPRMALLAAAATALLG